MCFHRAMFPARCIRGYRRLISVCRNSERTSIDRTHTLYSSIYIFYLKLSDPNTALIPAFLRRNSEQPSLKHTHLFNRCFGLCVSVCVAVHAFFVVAVLTKYGINKCNLIYGTPRAYSCYSTSSTHTLGILVKHLRATGNF